MCNRIERLAICSEGNPHGPQLIRKIPYQSQCQHMDFPDFQNDYYDRQVFAKPSNEMRMLIVADYSNFAAGLVESQPLYLEQNKPSFDDCVRPDQAWHA